MLFDGTHLKTSNYSLETMFIFHSLETIRTRCVRFSEGGLNEIYATYEKYSFQPLRSDEQAFNSSLNK